MEVIDDTANPSADLLPVVPLNQSINQSACLCAETQRSIGGFAG